VPVFVSAGRLVSTVSNPFVVGRGQ
jgi:hypothetical protein